MHILIPFGAAIRDDGNNVLRVGGRKRGPRHTPGRAQPSEDERLDTLFLQEIVQTRRLKRRDIAWPPCERDVVHTATTL